jgi:hypothetical protein
LGDALTSEAHAPASLGLARRQVHGDRPRFQRNKQAGGVLVLDVRFVPLRSAVHFGIIESSIGVCVDAALGPHDEAHDGFSERR